MDRTPRRRLTYANVVSTLALAIALGGGVVYAAGKIHSSQIARSAVRSKQIKDGAIRSADVGGDSLTGASIREDSLAPVPSAQSADTANHATSADAATTATTATDAIHAGSADAATTATSADDAANLGGTPAAGFLRYGSTIPSGTTVTGAFGYKGAGTTDYDEVVSFPLRAPAAVDNLDVSFDDSSVSAAAALNSEESSACTGTVSNPTAPAGKVCLYLVSHDVAPNTATGNALLAGNTAGTRLGFSIQAVFSGDNAGTFLYGTWAYRAP